MSQTGSCCPSVLEDREKVSAAQCHLLMKKSIWALLSDEQGLQGPAGPRGSIGSPSLFIWTHGAGFPQERSLCHLHQCHHQAALLDIQVAKLTPNSRNLGVNQLPEAILMDHNFGLKMSSPPGQRECISTPSLTACTDSVAM